MEGDQQAPETAGMIGPIRALTISNFICSQIDRQETGQGQKPWSTRSATVTAPSSMSPGQAEAAQLERRATGRLAHEGGSKVFPALPLPPSPIG
jgi:hypothetical protein